ncbi:MAG: helix-turn-helix transcriptional regulator [Clostridia bacterium]|nr:helix-turn-helix transcriptional regulator [Clostridia bacterium]
MKVCSAVVKRLRELADSKNISLYKLQKDSGIPEGTFLSLIYGNRKGVNLTTLLQLIQTLGVSPKEFFDSTLFNEENLDI